MSNHTPLHPRRVLWLWPLALAVLFLSACSEGVVQTSVRPWSSSELEAVFDLSELGPSLSVDAERGTLVLAGRPIPAGLLEAMPYLTMGRTHNLLRLADDVLLAMDGDVRYQLTQASPAELRNYLSDYGLTMKDLQRAWRAAPEVGLGALYSAAAELDARSHRSALGVATVGGAGQRLLSDLGLLGLP